MTPGRDVLAGKLPPGVRPPGKNPESFDPELLRREPVEGLLRFSVRRPDDFRPPKFLQAQSSIRRNETDGWTGNG